jgi:predicted nucleotidyltransferase
MTIYKQPKQLNDHDLRRLVDVFRKYPDIQAVYLFGSRASGKTHADSDLDLAIVPRDRAVRAKRLDLLTDLVGSGFCDVDLLFLDTDDIVLKYEAIRQNQLIYYTEDFDRGEIFSKIIRQYLDFAPYLEVQREAYKQRIQHG